MALPMPRLPECSITQTRFSSSRHTSMKWLPPPSVPSWCTQLEFLPMRLSMPGCFCEDRLQILLERLRRIGARIAVVVLAEAHRHVAA